MKTTLILILGLMVSYGFTCKQKQVGNCHYQECQGRIKSYPEDILMIVPENVQSLRLHFHGHILGVLPEYEKNLVSMIKTFDLEERLCQSNEVTVFPKSIGNCKTYDTNLKTENDFRTFIDELGVGHLPLHISAHSGGGRTVTRLLQTQLPISSVSLYEGIYSEETVTQLKKWYQQKSGDLKLASIKGSSPDKFASLYIETSKIPVTTRHEEISNRDFEVMMGERLIHLRRASSSSSIKSHYEILSETW